VRVCNSQLLPPPLARASCSCSHKQIPQKRPCNSFYTNAHSYQFTPTTEKVILKVTAYQNAAMKGILYLDNINIEVAEAPKVAFFYNDRGHRIRKEFYDDSGNTNKTPLARASCSCSPPLARASRSCPHKPIPLLKVSKL